LGGYTRAHQASAITAAVSSQERGEVPILGEHPILLVEGSIGLWHLKMPSGRRYAYL